MRPARCQVLLWIAALVALAGCSSEPACYPVKGRVVYKGIETPLPWGGIITFVSTTPAGFEASGRIAPDGSFTLESSNGPGTVAGDHRVRIDPEVPDDPQSSANRTAARAKILDAHYLDAETSGLVYTVAPGENDIKVEVERP